jgi:hypothetical protein
MRHQENIAKHPLKERTGLSLTTQVFGMHSRNVACERPSRLRRFGGFATFFMAQPPLLRKEGNAADAKVVGNSFTAVYDRALFPQSTKTARS